MARFVSLKFAAGVTVVGLDAMTCFSAALRAQAPMQEQAPMQVQAPASTPPVKIPATNGAPVVTVPAPQSDALGKYGKILVPGDEAAHPLKLKLPFPGAGEVKVPTPDELGMRQKLEELAKVSDEEIHAQLEQWPAYSKMSLRDQGLMLQRIQDFRDYRTRTALLKAHDMGLLTLTPDQKAKFEKEYWDKRLKMDQDLVKQFGPAFKARQQKMEDELFREFSTGMGPIAQGPKPPLPPAPMSPAAIKPAPGSPPVAQAPR